MCGCFKCVSEARHKRGGCFDEIQPFRSISVSFCGGVLNRQIHSEKLKTIHSDIHREIHSSINIFPQLNPQLKLGGGEGGYDLSPSLGPWAVEIHFRYSTFCHAGFVGPLQTYRCCWGGQHGRACLPRRLSAIMGNRRGINHPLICLRGEFPKPAGVTGRCKMGPEDYFEGSLSR